MKSIPFKLQETGMFRLPDQGYVIRFQIVTDYVKKFDVQNVGGDIHNELWVPAEELEEFNSHIVGLIEVTKTFV